MKRPVIVILLVLLASGCCGRGVRWLDALETVLPERPDSVLAVLEQRSPRRFCLPRYRAQYALLKSWAMDKCYIDTDDDSLIRIATDYYGVRGCSRHRMLSWYYLGRVQFNAGNYPAALVSADRALEDARALGDDHNAGMAYRMMGDCYENSWNPQKKAESFASACEMFDKEEDRRYYLNAKSSLARSEYGLMHFDASLRLLFELLNETDDASLRSYCYMMIVSVYVNQDEPDAAQAMQFLRQWQALPEVAPTAQFYKDAAVAFELLGERDSASLYMNKAAQVKDYFVDDGALSSGWYKILRHRGQYQESIDSLMQGINAQNTIVYSLLNQSVEADVRDYYHAESLRKEVNLSRQRVWIISLLFAFFVTVIVIIVLARRHRRQKMALSIAKEEVASLVRTNKTISESFNAFTKYNQRIVGNILHSYYSESDERYRRQSVYQHVEDFILSLKEDTDTFRDMEKRLNIDGLLESLRRCLPEIPSYDYRILCFFFAGFSYESICFLTGLDKKTLYNKKRQYKYQIEHSQDSSRQRLLDRL